MEAAHGGYLARPGRWSEGALAEWAIDALVEAELDPRGCSLRLSRSEPMQLLRLAFDGPRFEGRPGARWYSSHHALACRLSLESASVVHVYAFDPDGFEEVVAYGGGRRVGGDRLLYSTVELTEEAAADDCAFDQARERWPLGRLAWVLGITRRQLLSLAEAPSARLALPVRRSRATGS